jgi:hypothetical protein
VVAKAIEGINQKDNKNNIRRKTEWKLATNTSIRNEVVGIGLTITKTDKGKL